MVYGLQDSDVGVRGGGRTSLDSDSSDGSSLGSLARQFSLPDDPDTRVEEWSHL